MIKNQVKNKHIHIVGVFPKPWMSKFSFSELLFKCFNTVMSKLASTFYCLDIHKTVTNMN